MIVPVTTGACPAYVRGRQAVQRAETKLKAWESSIKGSIFSRSVSNTLSLLPTRNRISSQCPGNCMLSAGSQTTLRSVSFSISAKSFFTSVNAIVTIFPAFMSIRSSALTIVSVTGMSCSKSPPNVSSRTWSASIPKDFINALIKFDEETSSGS